MAAHRHTLFTYMNQVLEMILANSIGKCYILSNKMKMA